MKTEYKTHRLYLCIAATILLNLSNAVKISETDCTQNAGTDCTTFGHAECDTAVSDAKCKCSDGYEEDSGDGRTCVKVKVSEADCTKNAGTECTAIDHAECDNAVSDAKCKCSDGYKEDSGDGSTCVKVARVTETDCTKDTGTGCSALNHAECNNADSDAKCKCSDGYKEGSSDGSTCVKAKVSETLCTKDTGTECSAIGHAECDNAVSSAKCKCSDGYKEDSGDGNTCVKVLGTDCSGSNPCPGADNSVCNEDSCACAENYEEKNNVCALTVSANTCTASGGECVVIANAECDTDVDKCKCSPGYVMNVDVCAVENAATSIGCGTVTFVLFLFLTITNILG